MSHPRRPCRSYARSLSVHVVLLLLLSATPPARAQLSATDVDALRDQGERAGWTFSVSENEATARDLGTLCGLRPPPDWQRGARFVDVPALRSLPAAFDWRTTSGCPPVRNQLNCGSCWAFATVGPLECNIKIKDGVTVDLSEQFLVSCNPYGYDCVYGGWFVHDMHLAAPVYCGGAGAVLESVFPYTATDAPCNCPYARAYTIDDWAFIGDGSSVPTASAIKQAIYTYGPVSVGIHVDAGFQAYGGGIFNACADGDLNHAVVLVGWDDNQGPGGVWILRNSWGPTWGESGYMRILYGCARVGYAACYVEYAGATAPRIQVTPTALNLGPIDAGLDTTTNLVVKNVGIDPLSGTASGVSAPFEIVGTATYTLNSGESTTLTIRFAPQFVGTFRDALLLTGGGGASVPVTGTATGDAEPADSCLYAPTVSDGTYHGDDTLADTEHAASCGGGGTSDIWWRFTPPYGGVATLDTIGSDFDTVLSIYDACGGTELACNDDADGTRTTSRLSLAVISGRTYPVRIAGCAGQTGSVVLTVTTEHQPLHLSGRTVDSRNQGVPGVTLNGLPGSPVTDAAGRCTATVDYGFTGTVTPSKTGWLFTPAQRSYSELAADYTGNDFAARPVTFIVSGRVTDAAGTGLPGVAFNGFATPVVSDTVGRYSVAINYGFSGNVVPVLAGFAFAPTNRAYANVTADRSADDYVARVLTSAVRVTLEPAEAVNAGALWQLDNGAWQATGATLNNLTVGSHVLDYAAIEGWSAPAHEIVTIVPDACAVVTRHYEPRTYLLTIDVEPVGAGTVSVTPAPGVYGMYKAGTIATLSATPTTGYGLGGWTGVDSVSDADGQIATVAINANRTVRADFARVEVAGAHEATPQQPFAPLLCGGFGAGTAAVLPLMLAGICGLKYRRARQRERG